MLVFLVVLLILRILLVLLVFLVVLLTLRILLVLLVFLVVLLTLRILLVLLLILVLLLLLLLLLRETLDLLLNLADEILHGGLIGGSGGTVGVQFEGVIVGSGVGTQGIPHLSQLLYTRARGGGYFLPLLSRLPFVKLTEFFKALLGVNIRHSQTCSRLQARVLGEHGARVSLLGRRRVLEPQGLLVIRHALRLGSPGKRYQPHQEHCCRPARQAQARP